MAVTPIPEQNPIGPFITYMVGIILTALVFIFSGWVGAHKIFLYIAPNQPSLAYWGFYLVAIPTTFWFWFEGNRASIAIGFVGVPTLFGKRLDSIFGMKHIFGMLLVLSEGEHWVFPILGGYIEVDHRIQPSNEIEVTQLSSDGILMTGKFTYRYQITKPFRYLDARRELTSLDDVARTVMRDAIADSDSGTIGSGDEKTHLADTIAKAMIRISEEEYGVGIIKVMVSSILPPKEYEEALSKKRTEEAKREAEKVILASFSDRLRELKAEGLSAERAAEVIQNERGTAKSEYKTFRVDGAEASAKILADAIKAVFGKETT